MQPRDVPSRSPQAWGMQRKQTLDIGLFFHSLIIIIKFLIFFLSPAVCEDSRTFR